MGNWYVSGFCRNADAERVFRVDRIQALELTDERFEPPPTVPTPAVDYVPGEEDTYATIRLAPEAAWVADYYPVERIEDGADGLVVRFSSNDPSVAARLLLRLGGDAELMEGDEVAASLEDLRSRLLARYA